LPYQGVDRHVDLFEGGSCAVLAYTCANGHSWYGADYVEPTRGSWAVDELQSWSVPRLKKEALKWRLATSGAKDELVGRLYDFGINPFTRAMLTNYTMPVLREMASWLGIPEAGQKADLIDRILHAQAERWRGW
jgi:hypothetical protein